MMRVIGYILAGSLALSVLKAGIQVAAVLSIGTIVWLGVTRPQETFGTLFLFTALGLIDRFPAAGLAVFGALAILGLGISPQARA